MTKQRRGRMTVKDLREALDGVPDDTPVTLASDAEGNDYRPLDQVDVSEGSVTLWPE